MTPEQTQKAFLAFADRSMSRPVKAQLRAVEKRRMHRAQKKALIKAVSERDLLMKLWKRWREHVIEHALEGKHQLAIQQLVDLLADLTLKDQPQLVEMILKNNWTKAHADLRFLALTLIDAKFIRLNERQKLPPFNDSLPGQQLSPFLQIRKLLEHNVHGEGP